MDPLTTIVSAVGGIITLYVVQNSKLKEGFTEYILNLLGKFGTKKINLKSHRAFIILRNYKNQLNLFLLEDRVKSIFYKEFIGIMFKNILLMAECIINRLEAGEKGMEFAIMEELENCHSKIDNDVFNMLEIPAKIQNKIEHWKTRMIASLKNSVENLITDDINNEDYFKVYRTLDAFLNFSIYVTSTGSILFNDINGAFKDMELDDIYKNESKNIE